jgi:inhibitor of KinA sporulation pathway (predicted exonuclease)
MEQEIIEIGAYKVDPAGQLVDEFDSLIKPVVHPSLSSFCQELTGIEQSDVNNADTFEVVFQQFYEWIHPNENDSLLLSWGTKDYKLIRHQCAKDNIDLTWFNYGDLKGAYRQMMNLSRSVGLARALKNEGIDFEGEMHNALDDSYNLSSLFVKYLHQWMKYL